MRVPNTDGEYSVSVTASSSWSASTVSDFIVIPEMQSVNMLVFKVEQNNNDEIRVGTIDITDGLSTVSVTVVQGDGEDLLIVTPSSLTFPTSGGTGTLEIISDSDWEIQPV